MANIETYSFIFFFQNGGEGSCSIYIAGFDDEKRKRGPTRKWIQRREEEGLYANLVQELMVEDNRTYREMMRMDYECFKHILQLIEPYITLQNSGVSGQRVVTAAERLVLMIRFLTTGETFSSLNLQFCISE